MDTRGRKPDLVRYSKDGYERYTPDRETEWSRSRFLDALAWGGGDFVWYDEIGEVKAKKYMAEIREFLRKEAVEEG